MLEEKIINEFLREELRDIEIPGDITFNELTKAFINYCETDYYDWLRDNAKSFFEGGIDGIDWEAIRKRIRNTNE